MKMQALRNRYVREISLINFHTKKNTLQEREPHCPRSLGGFQRANTGKSKKVIENSPLLGF